MVPEGMNESEKRGPDFIRQIIRQDLDSGKIKRVVTRFPPEPNGYLHIGHAKAIVLNFSIAKEFGGCCHLRFDDTNPERENTEFVKAMEEDIRWLGFEWEGETRYASSYFSRLYEWAVELVRAGKAYIDNQSPEEISRGRGTPATKGIDSPWRERSVEENLAFLEKMRQGLMKEGECVLRAKIDMQHVNILMRDPPIYRILRVAHHRSGTEWSIYPMYDFAHCLEDAIEGITHSLCSLEFENHRPVYDWFLDNVTVEHRPRQYEFARLSLTNTVLSKRHLRRLVEEGHVSGWDDPRMPTLRGMRRRGYPPEALRNFIRRIGVSKVNSIIKQEYLDFHVREQLNRETHRRMAVLAPVKLTIANWPDGKVEAIRLENLPGESSAGSREVDFCGELWVERGDYMDDPPCKWFRLGLQREVRLKGAYFVRVREVLRDDEGCPVEIICEYDPESRGGETPDGRKVKGTIHWLSRQHSLRAEIRLYGGLLAIEDSARMEEGCGPADYLNPSSLEVLHEARVESSLAGAAPESRFQFMRSGYFVADREEYSPERLVFNRIVGLRDTWARIAGR